MIQVEPDVLVVETEPGFVRRLAASVLRDKLVLAALVVFTAVLLIALLAPLLSPQNPYDLSALDLSDSRLRPGARGVAGQLFPLGTDDQGRDMLSAIFYGLRISIVVGLTSSLTAMVIGSCLGALAGYYGGAVDAIVMRLVDIQLSIPSILVALILLAFLGRGVDKIILSLVAVQWVYFARTVRGVFLIERRKDYVQAFRLLGFSDLRIMLLHILPNTLPAVSVVATVEFASAISLEATLSFLGVGLPITEPSLGLLIANGFAYLLNGEYWISIYPGVALLLAVFSLNILSDHLRDALNPRLQK